MKKLALLCLFCVQLSALQSNAALDQSLAYAPVRAKHGMVATSDQVASQVGVEILKHGGNAVDAAVAVAFALAVTLPAAGNLGGGGFMLIRTANGTTTAIDYREIAPKKSHRAMYLDENGNVVPGATTTGHRAVAVPGTVAGLAFALEKYGTMTWRDVIEPARRLAVEGVTLSYMQSMGRRRHRERLAEDLESRRIFLRDGRFYEWGDTFRQPELAETLKRLQDYGPREFYEGRTAKLIAAEMQAGGGLITLEDLKSYEIVERQPVRGTYRGYEIVSVPPPSSGGTVLIEMLNMLEHYDVADMGYNSSAAYHLLIEVMRRAFADRARHFGDPAFVAIPVATLLSKRYATELAKSIDLNRATQNSSNGNPSPPSYEPPHTTHFSVVDAASNAVSNTYSLNGAYGSGVTVTDAGFLLNNTMDDFAAKPGAANKSGLVTGEANAIVAGKRPLSSMTPSMVLKEGKLFLVIGTPGGPTIITQILQVIANVIDHGMNIQQAVNATRIHHQWLPDVVRYESYGIAPDVMEALRKKGHTFEFTVVKDEVGGHSGYPGDVEAIVIDPATGIRLGAADPRNPDARAIGY